MITLVFDITTTSVSTLEVVQLIVMFNVPKLPIVTLLAVRLDVEVVLTVRLAPVHNVTPVDIIAAAAEGTVYDTTA